MRRSRPQFFIKAPALILLILALGGVTMYNACGNPVRMEAGLEKPILDVAGDGTGDASDLGNPAGATPEQINQVRMLCESGVASVQELQLDFPNPGECEWEMDGNLNRIDQRHQARREQYLEINLPQGSTLCNLELLSEQEYKFDDHFFLTFDESIIGASLNYKDRFETSGGISRYDWNKIVGTHWDKSREGAFCLPGASCSWPKTDTLGTIKINFPRGVMYPISAVNQNRTQHLFGLITIGDNDGTDCQHLPVDFKAKVHYVTN